MYTDALSTNEKLMSNRHSCRFLYHSDGRTWRIAPIYSDLSNIRGIPISYGNWYRHQTFETAFVFSLSPSYLLASAFFFLLCIFATLVLFCYQSEWYQRHFTFIFENVRSLTELFILFFPIISYSHIWNTAALIQEFDEMLEPFPNVSGYISRRIYFSWSITFVTFGNCFYFTKPSFLIILYIV